MKLIADSGSTKTQWYCIQPQRIAQYTTQGYNPYYCTTDEIKQSLESELVPKLKVDEIKQIYFYGAGCSHPSNQKLLQTVLSSVFENATIDVGTDLLAAARATAMHQAGICCILGTGTNSCYYDGNQIADNLPPLGYILGDEGSGAALGKMVLQAYFYREMPKELENKMQLFANMDRHLILDKLFNESMPSRFLASFALFCVENIDALFIQKLVQDNFDQFIQKHLLKYDKATELPVHFIGSVAHGFQDLLIPTLLKNNLKVGKILKTPFPSLLDY